MGNSSSSNNISIIINNLCIVQGLWSRIKGQLNRTSFKTKEEIQTVEIKAAKGEVSVEDMQEVIEAGIKIMIKASCRISNKISNTCSLVSNNSAEILKIKYMELGIPHNNNSLSGKIRMKIEEDIKERTQKLEDIKTQEEL